MPQVAFFPWFAIRDPVAFGPFQLSPYQRGALPGGENQAVLDELIRPYVTGGDHSIDRCSLLSLAESPLVTDWSSEQRDAMFHFAELLAFSGLATRSFFNQIGYCNRDNFRLVIQSFDDPGRGTLIVTRRRDGVTRSFYSGDTYRVISPQHVPQGSTGIDGALLRGLLSAEDMENWPQMLEAVILFNEANTDRDFMPEAAELVLTCAALEQLLDSGYRPAAMAQQFERIWVPDKPLPKAEWKIRSEDEGANRRLAAAGSLRSGWVEDLGIVRGSIAHGHGAQAYRGVWSPAEHLLFASFAVPRLLKVCLSTAGFYSLTDDDWRDLDALELLLNERHFVDCRPWDHPWPKVLGRAGISRLARRIAEEYLGSEQDNERGIGQFSSGEGAG